MQNKQSNILTHQTTQSHQVQIPTPSQKELEYYLNAFKTDSKMERYRDQESALKNLFKVYPQNNNLSGVYIKALVLNTFYSTRILNVFAVATHIKDIKDIDKRLENGDESLVAQIASVRISGKDKYFYSFATKFCSFHNNKDYAIYDSYVAKVLTHFKQDFRKEKPFNQNDLRDYAEFMQILEDFKKRYELECDLKSLDLYLWQLGKKYFTPDNQKQ